MRSIFVNLQLQKRVPSQFYSGCQMLTEMVLTKPNETMRAAEAMLSVFDQLQNQTTLWESLLAVPQLFSSSSDQVLDSTKAVITNLQG